MAARKGFRFPAHQSEEGQTSWLEYFSSSHRTASHASAALSPSLTTPDPTKITRIDALRATLADIKDSIDIRTFEYNLVTNHGLFCRSCSRVAKPGTCGPTCALLTPPTGSLEPWFSQKWYSECKADEARYYSTLRAVTAAGYKAHSSQIKQWEVVVERVRKGIMNEADRANAGAAIALKVTNLNGTFKQDWSFEGAWGKGSTSMDFAPNDVSSVE